MNNRSPIKIIELCIYIIIIIAAAILLITGGKLSGTADIPTSGVMLAEPQDKTAEKPPPVIVPKEDVFPEERDGIFTFKEVSSC